MKKTVIVFREQHFYFGLFATDFEQHFSLSSAWVTPSPQYDTVWQFELDRTLHKGRFFHLGSLFGAGKVSIGHTGYVFMKKRPDNSTFGVYMNNFLFQISLTKNRHKVLKMDQVKRLPSKIPTSVFRYVIRYKRRNIFVIDPLELFSAYSEYLPQTA